MAFSSSKTTGAAEHILFVTFSPFLTLILLSFPFSIPKGYLMNRTGDVNADGNYVSQIKDRKKRVGITLGTLSMGRVGIISISVVNMQKALTVGIRYSAARRQFGPPSAANAATGGGGGLSSVGKVGGSSLGSGGSVVSVASSASLAGSSSVGVVLGGSSGGGSNISGLGGPSILGGGGAIPPPLIPMNSPSQSALLEWPVLDYQMQQWRLLPYLAATYVLDVFCQSFLRDFLNFQVAVLFGTSSPSLSELGQEIHAIACAAKPLSGWLCRDAIQECREACGGHGYLAASGLGTLRDDHDANNTYEGDNNVIQMQTSNYILRQYKEAVEARKNANGTATGLDDEPPHDGRVRSQLKSVDLLDQAELHLKRRFGGNTVADVLSLDFLLEAYRFLVSYLLTRSLEKLDEQMGATGGDTFVSRSNSQVHRPGFATCTTY